MSTEAGRAKLGPLWLILALSAAPFVLATLMYFYWKPSESHAVGTLLAPIRPLPDVVLQGVDARPYSTADLRGKWTLLTVSRGPCGADCRDVLFRMRQIRTAQGAAMQRVQRVWVADEAGQLAAPEDLTRDVIRLADAGRLAPVLPAGPDGLAGDVFLLDPNGNLVMRYEPTVDPVKMIREIAKLLKLNNGLG